MSMPSLEFHCNECDFYASSMVNWGDFNYQHNDKLLSVNRVLGWCEVCASIRPIEELVNPNNLEQAITENEMLSLKFKSEKDALMEQRSRIAKILNLEPTLPDSTLSLKFEMDESSYSMNNMREHLSFLAIRKSPPRCLSCGSHKITPLPSFESPEETNPYEENESDNYEDAPSVYVIDHPNCGGAIKANYSSVHFMIKMPERFFDIEGIELKNDN